MRFPMLPMDAISIGDQAFLDYSFKSQARELLIALLKGCDSSVCLTTCYAGLNQETQTSSLCATVDENPRRMRREQLCVNPPRTVAWLENSEV